MLLRKRLTVFLAAAMMLTMMSAAPAFAHHCTNKQESRRGLHRDLQRSYRVLHAF